MQATLLRKAAARICAPSSLDPRPRGVLMTRETFPDDIRATASSPDFSPTLATVMATETPASSKAFAVPLVAARENPNSAN
ncbi:unannotated protein [freshwater metagenome]|uniref:Unannotated protein n=1 Tax=freshwater metagenome TaxID=449393 RepID=A0A6J6RNI2_9ZZZZ